MLGSLMARIMLEALLSGTGLQNLAYEQVIDYVASKHLGSRLTV
jgi:hypothetical protein